MPALDLERSLHVLPRIREPQVHQHRAEVGDRRRDQPFVARLLREEGRRPGVLDRSDQVAGDSGQGRELQVDRSRDRRVTRSLPEGLLTQADRLQVAVADVAQLPEEVCAFVSRREPRDDLLEDPPRAARVARGDVMLRRLDQATPRFGGPRAR